MRTIGFFGDSEAVVREIHREFRMNGHLFGALSPDARPRDVDEEVVTLSQVQCYRRCRGVVARQSLITTMKVKRGFGSMLRCWRLDLDKDGDGVVSRQQFESASHVLGCEKDVGVLWSAMRSEADQDPLELWDFSPGEAADLLDFASLLIVEAQWDLNAAWRFLDPMRTGTVDYPRFRSSCEDLGFEGDPSRLFKGLDSSGKGEVWLELMDPAWVMCLTNALPSKKRTRRMSRLSTQLGSSVRVRDIDLELNMLLRRLDLDKAGCSSMPDREFMIRLERIGFHGLVGRKACQLVRALTKKRDMAEGLIRTANSTEERPPWDSTDVVRRPRPFPLKYSDYHPALNARLFRTPQSAWRSEEW